METIPIRKIWFNFYSLWNVPIRSIFTFKKASEEFRRSQRIEVEDFRAWLEMVKNLGAAAVTMPGGEVYTT